FRPGRPVRRSWRDDLFIRDRLHESRFHDLRVKRSVAVARIEVVDRKLQPAARGRRPTLSLADKEQWAVVANAAHQTETRSRPVIAARQGKRLILNAVVNNERAFR